MSVAQRVECASPHPNDSALMRPISWLQVGAIPRGCAAVLDALQFSQDPPGQLSSLSERQWRTALDFADNSRLTLLLGDKLGTLLPKTIRERIDGNLKANRIRLRRLTDDYLSIGECLAAAGVEHVLLKGFLQAPRFVSDASLRQQYDLDLLLRPQDVHRARELIQGLGYEPAFGPPGHPADHLPPLVRKTGWQWRGDFFDAEMPTIVELHFRLWDEQTERIAVDGLEEFWERREQRIWDGHPVPAFHPADHLGFAALHLLRHLLRGDVTAFHVYEVAHFLEGSVSDDAFWASWTDRHDPSLRRLESLAVGLAACWFGCPVAPVVEHEIRSWPGELACWFKHYAAAPVQARFRPNKDELWLHLNLVARWPDRVRVLRRRLLPSAAPRPTDTAFIPSEQRTLALHVRKVLRHGKFLLSRAVFHFRALIATAGGAGVWWLRRFRAASVSERSREATYRQRQPGRYANRR